MNYRHAFHAGNFADVFKHAALVRVLLHLRNKEAPFRVIDTHAGIGRYSLTGEEARRSPEWMDGIGRLLKARLPADVAALVQPYLDVVATLNNAGDVLTLFCVNRATSQDLNAEIHLDGFQASKAQVQELKAASLDEGNDETDPKRVTPSITDVPVASPEIGHVFPHESVTVITLRK